MGPLIITTSTTRIVHTIGGRKWLLNPRRSGLPLITTFEARTPACTTRLRRLWAGRTFPRTISFTCITGLRRLCSPTRCSFRGPSRSLPQLPPNGQDQRGIRQPLITIISKHTCYDLSKTWVPPLELLGHPLRNPTAENGIHEHLHQGEPPAVLELHLVMPHKAPSPCMKLVLQVFGILSPDQL
jgi:hypothetical protein